MPGPTMPAAPAPWTVMQEHHVSEATPLNVMSAEGEVLAAVMNDRELLADPSPECRALAWMMAAAPDLLTALVGAMGLPEAAVAMARAGIYDKATAAIAKATGGAG